MADDVGTRWNYNVLLGQGVSLNAGYQLTSDNLVLPYLFTSVGGPVFVAGLLVPIVTVSKLVTQIVAAPLIGAARSNKWFVVLATCVTALALAIVCLTVKLVTTVLLVAIFLLAAVILGATSGINSLAFKNMIGRILAVDRSSRLLFTQSGLAGLLAIAIAFGSREFLPQATSLAAHQELIWLGIAMTVLAAALIACVHERAKRPLASSANADGRPVGHLEELRRSFAIAFALPWFGRFVIARILFLSIELAMPFYSIHAATFHAGKNTGLSTFVIASSLGLVVGGYVWPRLVGVSIRLAFVLAAGLACIGGVLALMIEMRSGLQSSPLIYAAVFTLVALGAQGTKNGRTVYLVGVTTDDDRSVCIAVASVVAGGVAIVLGAGLGTIASLKTVAWPIFIMVGLNVVAALFALTLSEIGTKAEPDRKAGEGPVTDVGDAASRPRSQEPGSSI